MKILSLGAGVQSTALMLMSAEGLLEKIDYAIFADTGAEPKAVYDHLNKLIKEVAEPAGIEVRIVQQRNLTEFIEERGTRAPSIPLFVKNPETGKGGMLWRKCTPDYKIAPIKRETRKLLGASVNPETGRIGMPPTGAVAEQWIGISTDEFHRAKDSDVKYVKHRFPLLDVGWSRQTCINYLEARGWGETPKSACLYCPFHSNKEWRNIRDNYPEEWEWLLKFDDDMRERPFPALTHTPYLHSSLLPLREAPIDRVMPKELAEAQLDMFGMATEEEFVMSCSPFSCKADDAEVDWVRPEGYLEDEEPEED